MKKLLAAAVAALFALSLAGCGTPAASASTAETAGQPVELVVFAAASLTETLTEIADTYEAAHPGVTLTFNFDSSGTLKTQVEEGAACDVFLSAAEKQLDQLEDLGLVDTATRLDLLENRVTLCVPEGNPASIQGFDDLAARLAAGDVLLAMGNSDVPVGQYTQKIFAHYGLDEGALASARVLTYGTNVKEVTAQVAEGSVDCGIVYATDAYSAGLTVVDTATRLDLLENRVTLCVPEGNPASIQGFDDLAARLAAGDVLLAMGNSDVPVGQYTQKIFAHYGLDEGALASARVLTYGTNVKEVTAQVAEGSVDCGIVYATDAYSAGLTVVDTATAELCGQVLYPGAVLSGSAHPAEAAAFLDYLSTPEAMKIFASVGFSAP